MCGHEKASRPGGTWHGFLDGGHEIGRGPERSPAPPLVDAPRDPTGMALIAVLEEDAGELVGRLSTATGNTGTGSHSVIHAGASYSIGPTAIGLVLSRGLSKDAESFGATLAVSFGFRVFRHVSPG